jgi:hypothetical protein
MSNLALPNHDDHPEAARKHLGDAFALQQAGRADGAAYLSGYVIECCLKTLILYEQAVPSAGAPKSWRGRQGHDLKRLHADVSSVAILAGARTARYFGVAIKRLTSAAITGWDPELRYRAPAMSSADGTKWYEDADSVYQETVGQMLLDGVL